ncbi:MAG: antibiotic biosynthesis monooxygenase [Vicinamibacterales bacterium]
MSAGSEVVSIIRHQVRPGSDGAYEAWLEAIVPVARTFPGHLGVTVVRPPEGSRTYTIVVRFDALAHLRGWLESGARHDLLATIAPQLMTGDDVEIRTGLEFWLTPPPAGRRMARPWKQFLLALSVIYPLSLLVPRLLEWLIGRSPVAEIPWLRGLLVASAIVALMTWVIMPRYTRLVARWLYADVARR